MSKETATMKVSGRGLKINIADAFDELVCFLNEADRIGLHNDFIAVNIDELKEHLRYLRGGIAALCFCYIDNEEEPDFFPVHDWNPKYLTEEDRPEE